ncbi:MAG: hypothetical protein ISS53_02370 [Dehalococcoidia bacterium]|nr:hypothetical protein [Dehalococcoidia bacterium]
MEMSQKSPPVEQRDDARHILRRIRLTDPKTDVFLAANVMDAVLTYLALQHGAELTEFNSIINGIMNTIGIGTTLFLKVVLCVGLLWILRKTKREKLLIPLSAIFIVIALSNLFVARAHGIEV